MRDVLIGIIAIAANILSLLIIARALMSFFPVDRNHLLVRLVFNLTEPILAPIRSLLPQGGMLDFSPMVAILLIILLQPLLTYLVRALLP